MASNLSARLQAARAHQRDFSPVSWTEYFDEAHDVELESSQDTFRVYLRNFKPPMAPQRSHGQAVDATRIELTQKEFRQYAQFPTLVTLHGGGYSALTWAQFTRYIEQYCQCRLLAIDLRSHGDTKTSNDEQMDIDTLVSDVIQVVHATHKLICGFPETPKIILIGHSMGGAIAVKCATKSTELLPSLDGFVIIDVVEGTAKDALPLMMSVIKTRPNKFCSLDNAIEWSVRSGMAKNAEAARVSMPGNLLNIAEGHLAVHDIIDGSSENHNKSEMKSTLKRHKFHIKLENLIAQNKGHSIMTSLPRGLPLPPRIAALRSDMPPIVDSSSSLISSKPTSHAMPSDASMTQIQEESEDRIVPETERPDDGRSRLESNFDGDGYKKPPELDSSGYCWRTDLAKTQPFWSGWFDGLSNQLLEAPVQGKFLLLAGIDRLDKTLTIGQMQGKFMMKVLPKCGHAVHEDVPQQVASVIAQFLVRNKFTTSTNTSATDDHRSMTIE